MRTILVLNAKGGCGKSTIATNLASLYASGQVKTALMDYDPQGSSLQWLSLRAKQRPPIHAVDARRTKVGQTRAWQTAVPGGTEWLIIDAPAGVTGLALQDLVRRCDTIIVPVAPSPIDIHVTSDFVRELLLAGKVRKYGIHVGVVANRVRRETPHYEPLKRFLSSLNIPFIASFTDTENYIIAAEHGIGIHEMEQDLVRTERDQWIPLIRWLASPAEQPHRAGSRPQLNLVSVARG